MNCKEQILAYEPKSKQEQACKEQMLEAIHTHADTIFSRQSLAAHFTSAGLILNPSLDRVLMVHHSIYNAYCWTGGHADGDTNLLEVAIKEAMEETGLVSVFPLSPHILSLDSLPVKAHTKSGSLVKGHQHLNVTYGLIAPENQPVFCNPQENTAVKWISLAELDEACTEGQLLPIYHKLVKRMQKLAANQQEVLALCPLVPPLLRWYDENSRILPWRENCNPYDVWVSEVMLQQTRVEAVKPFFQRFIKQLPNLQALADAQEGTLMKLWEGLGYYNRARNLQKTARIICTEYGGRFPEEIGQLLALPGIGAYTAGAISAICFHKPTPAVDGNVMRVFARLTENYGDIGNFKLKAEVTQKLGMIYPRVRSGDFCQSLMELGAIVCTPGGAPKCLVCPLQFLCKANQNQTQTQLPQKAKKATRRKELKTVLLLCFNNQVAIRQREETGLLGGLWEFPNLEGAISPQQVKALLQEWRLPVTSLTQGQTQKHIFTHIEWEMNSYLVQCKATNPEFVWVTKETLLQQITMPTAFKRFCNLLQDL